MLPLLALDTDAPALPPDLLRNIWANVPDQLGVQVRIELSHRERVHIAVKVEVDYSEIEKHLGYRSKEYNGREPASDWERNQARLLTQVKGLQKALLEDVARELQFSLVTSGMIDRPSWYAWKSEFDIEQEDEQVFRDSLNQWMPRNKVLMNMQVALSKAKHASNIEFKLGLEKEWKKSQNGLPVRDSMRDWNFRSQSFGERIRDARVRWGPLQTAVVENVLPPRTSDLNASIVLPPLLDTTWLYSTSAAVSLTRWTAWDMLMFLKEGQPVEEEPPAAPAPKSRYRGAVVLNKED